MDPNPIKHIGSLLNQVVTPLEPQLLAAGFIPLPYDVRNQPRYRQFRDFQRRNGSDLLSISYFQHEACLLAECLLDSGAECRTVRVPLDGPRSTEALMNRCDEFVNEVVRLLNNLGISA